MEERIRARIAHLEAAQHAYAREANRQMAAFDTAIGELQTLLRADADPPDDAPASAAEQSGQE